MTVPLKPTRMRPNEERSFIVEAGAFNCWTGVQLDKGGQYTFDFPDGQTWYDSKIDCGPEGWTVKGEEDELSWVKEYVIRHAEDDRRSASANWFEVIGALNESDDDLFRIGDRSKSREPYTCPYDATLFCFANDLKSKYGNNRGRVTICIKRVK